MHLTDSLFEEHGKILIFLKSLEKMLKNSPQDLTSDFIEKTLDFLKIFVDACHHGKEEKILFPAIEKKTSKQNALIKTLLEEHTIGRSYVKKMEQSRLDLSKFSEGATPYIQLLYLHIEKENNLLFTFAESLFKGTKEEILLKKAFNEIEQTVLSKEKKELFQTFLNTQKRSYLL